MASLTDRWTRPGPTGRRVKSERHGKGLRWLVEWVEPGGQKRRKSFGNKDAAGAHKARMEVELNEDRYVTPEKRATTYADLWPVFWQIKSTKAKPTREGYLYPWEGYIREAWGDEPVANTSQVKVRAWLTGLRTKAGEPVSPAYERKILLTMKALAEMAVDDGIIAKNPLAKVKARSPLPSARRYLSIAEVDSLLKALGGNALVAEVLVMTGIRKGECFGLQVRDLDARRGRLLIERDVDDEGGVDPTKSRRHRDVPVRGELLVKLQAAAKGRKRTDWLLRGPDGGGWRAGKWRTVWERATKAAGLAGYDTHELRHTAASLAIQAGANVKAVQRMLGHADATQTLNTYSHLWGDELDEVAERMETLLEAERRKSRFPPDSPQE